MSEESQLNRGTSARRLRPAEQDLLQGMLAASGRRSSTASVASSPLVEDMDDGGMGSIRFLSPPEKGSRSARVIAQAEYVDEDGVPVSITINADQDGELFELDFWKVDFSPVKRYPNASDIRHVPTQ